LVEVPLKESGWLGQNKRQLKHCCKNTIFIWLLSKTLEKITQFAV
jgi:hypothetical protein